jgi:hydrocephalus-inducing protein
MAYRLNTHELDFGDVHFDKSATRTLTLTNVGSVPLDYHFLNLNQLNSNEQIAQIDVEPDSGICAPFTSTIITIKFIPNIPENFEKILFLQIAHFQPDEIRLIGQGMFCRLELNLPRYIVENSFEQKLFEEIKDITDESQLQRQLDTRVVQNFVQKSNEQFIESIEQPSVSQQQSIRLSNASLTASTTTSLTKRSISSKSVPVLPDYLIDFDYIILGTVRQQIIHIRNPTSTNITFHFDRLAFKNTGFSFDCDHVKNLPAGESITITITFDPRGANLGLRPVECRVPVEVRIKQIIN